MEDASGSGEGDQSRGQELGGDGQPLGKDTREGDERMTQASMFGPEDNEPMTPTMCSTPPINEREV